MGIIPAIIARAVISTARSRPALPSSVASVTTAPPRREFSANVTRRMAFATEMPIAMIAPMKDCTFRVVPVSRRMSKTPQITAGTVETTANASRKD